MLGLCLFLASEFTPLFNGRDLTGWTVVGDPTWKASSGTIVCEGGNGGWLRSEREYENFVFRLEYRVMKEGGNSGLFLRATEEGNPAFTGMEVQILADHGKPPGIHSSSSLYGSIAPAKNAAKPAGEWNRAEIVCEGRHLEATINGERVLDANLDDPKIPFQEKSLRDRARKGFLGLQNHSDAIEFRNLEIRELPSWDIDLPGGNILSCETYSFHRLLQSKAITLEQIPARLRDLGIRGIAWNDIYFANFEPECLRKIKAEAEKHGRVTTAFIIDIHGDFATEVAETRQGNIEAVSKRLEAAKFLGAPVVRINVGGTGKGDAEDRTLGVQRVTEAFQALIPRAKVLNLRLAIENHWGASSHAESVRQMIEGSDPRWVGSCLDFKNWPKGDDFYESCQLLAPLAFHAHAKSHAFDPMGEETGADYARIFRFLREAGYKGAISIEWEGAGDAIEGIRKTRDLIVRRWIGES